MNCKSCRKLIFDRRDGSLAARDESAIDAHLLDCSECRDFFEAEKLLGGRIGAAFHLVPEAGRKGAPDRGSARAPFPPPLSARPRPGRRRCRHPGGRARPSAVALLSG